MTVAPNVAIHVLSLNRFHSAFNVASMAMLVFDYFLTLSEEVELVWKSRWNVVKVLFLLTRYLPFIDVAVVFLHQFSPSLTSKQCAISYEYSAWMFLVGMTITEILLTIRTWAVWEKDRRLTIGLPIFFILFWITEYIIIGFYLKTLQHKASSLQPLIDCVTLSTSRLLSICWIVLMAYDAGTLVLLVIQAVRTYRVCGNVPLARVIYRDGIIYYTYLFCLSFLNTVLTVRMSREFVTLLSLMERVIHSLLACRVILHIRRQNVKSNPQDYDEVDLMDVST